MNTVLHEILSHHGTCKENGEDFMITDTKEKGLEKLIVDWLRDHSRFALKFGIYLNNRKTQLDIFANKLYISARRVL